MPFQRLLHTTYGEIVLRNAAATVREGLLDYKIERRALRALRNVLRSLPSKYSFDVFCRELFNTLENRTSSFQVAGAERPNGDIYLAAVMEFGAISKLLHRVKSNDRGETYHRIDDAIARKPTQSALIEAANIINLAAQDMGTLMLALDRNIFWATTRDAFAQIELNAVANGQPNACSEARNVLGLGHIEPYTHLRPRPLYLFEAVRPLSEMKKELRVARPTTIDGFNNLRFRQKWGLPPRSHGSGLTVHLKSGFGDGAPEFVATGVPIRDNFRCRYLGNIADYAPGNDDEFLAYLKNVVCEPADELARELEQAMRRTRRV